MSWPMRYVIGRAGSPYLTRWDILGTRFKNLPRIFLHQFHRSDSDAALHDHPWWFVSIILTCGYYEQTVDGTRWYPRFSVLPRCASWAHRIVLKEGDEGKVYTLVITGLRVRSWGFHCVKGWTPWRVFVDREDAGKAGCGDD